MSRDEVEVFLRSIAPRSVSRYEIGALAAQIMREADTNRSGLIDFREFMRWNGKQAVLDWIDQYHATILSRWDGRGVTTRAPFQCEEPARVASPSYVGWGSVSGDAVLNVFSAFRIDFA